MISDNYNSRKLMKDGKIEIHINYTEEGREIEVGDALVKHKHCPEQ